MAQIPTNLAGARPELLTKFVQLVDAAARVGITVTVPPRGGVRTLAQQTALRADYDAAVARGESHTPAAPAGGSKHECGSAFDLNVMGKPTTITTDGAYRRLADLGQSFGLEAGYYYHTQDIYHFELTDSLAACQAAWAQLGRSNQRPAGAACPCCGCPVPNGVKVTT